MRKINKDALLEKAKRCHFTKAVIDCIEAFPEEDGLCEVNLEENAKRVCDILNADAEGKVWRPLTDEDIEEML